MFSQFYYIDMNNNLRYNILTADKEFHSLLLGRFERMAPGEEGYIRDIYDGEAYKQHMEADGFLANPMNLSFVMNTDGAQVFRSSNVTLWPVYLIINELAPHLR